eukprot:GFYU01046928.1.p1 GENE.GFYU01046928.1~~GFYU01046928.1.p1  ORF type:complete len:193 (+),score=0.15 GFYU01046928.1:100-678(+)
MVQDSTSDHVVHAVRIVFLMVCTGLAIAGTFGTQYKSNDGTTSLYLYQVDVSGTTTKVSDFTFSCNDQKRMLIASLSFGIIGWSCLAICLLFSIPPFFTEILCCGPADFAGFRFIAAGVRLGFTVAAAIGLLISFAISAALYNGEYCNSTIGDTFDYGYGFGLLVASWCLTFAFLVFEILTLLFKLGGMRTC